MSRVATLDVESVGRLPASALERETPEVLAFEELRVRISGEQAWAWRDEDPEEARDRYLALSAPLARPVCVGLLSHVRDKDGGWPRRAICVMDSRLLDVTVPEGAKPRPVQLEDGEAAMLRVVAGFLAHFDQVCTFNGREFDLPVLIHRMWAHKIPLPRVLAQALRGPAYKSEAHIDLVRQFGFQGAIRKPGPLRAFAAAVLGRDPKAETAGGGVAELVAQRDGYTLAGYNLGDVYGTGDLLESWLEHVGIV